MNNHYINVYYSELDEGYIAEIPNLEDCSAFGKTLDEALRKVLINQAARLEAVQAEGKAAPSHS